MAGVSALTLVGAYLVGGLACLVVLLLLVRHEGRGHEDDRDA